MALISSFLLLSGAASVRGWSSRQTMRPKARVGDLGCLLGGLAAASLSGCVELYPLDAVPIEGGTPEQVRVVRDGLEAFDALTGSPDILLRRIRFDPPRMEEYGAAYSRREILIDPALPMEDLPLTIRHELCHALDDTEGLSASEEDLLEAVAEDVLLPEEDINKNLRLGEVFARFCEAGPTVAELLRAPCPGDPELPLAVFAWLDDVVWAEPVLPPRVARAVGPVVEWAPLEEVTYARPYSSSTRSSEVFEMAYLSEPPMAYLSDPPSQPALFLNVYTAEEEPEPPWWGLDEGFDVDEVAAALPFGLRFGAPTGWPGGPGAAHVSFDGWWWDFEVGGRIFVWDGVELTPLEECAPPSESNPALFNAADQIWQFTSVDGTFSWSPLWR